MIVPDITIAVDGYSSTGKSTFAKMVAERFGLKYLDSGAYYRGVTLYAQREGLISPEGAISPEFRERLADGTLEVETTGSEIRSMKVSSQVSPISAEQYVRDFVDARLHAAGKNGRVIMDGRDIGTTVFPDAEIKIFMTASKEIRAKRRYDEMVAKGDSPVMEEVLESLLERDRIDSTRKASPLTQAPDAFVLDNTEMSLQEELFWMEGLIRGKFGILE